MAHAAVNRALVGQIRAVKSAAGRLPRLAHSAAYGRVAAFGKLEAFQALAQGQVG